jgi:hypothetical protein
MDREIARKREQEAAAQQVREPSPTTDEDRDTLRQTSLGLINLQYARTSAEPELGDAEQQEVAQQGIRGEGDALPHLETIQQAFGPDHDLSGVRAHTGPDAQAASEALGAQAYATGTEVAFGAEPDLSSPRRRPGPRRLHGGL